MERNQPVHKFWNELIAPLQGDSAAVHRQVVKGWTIQAGEGFQMGKSTLLIEDLGVALQGERRIKNAGATAGTLF